MKLTFLVEFSQVFKETERDLEYYLSGISRSTVLNSCAFFLGFSNTGSAYREHRELLSMFFCQKNNKLANEICQKLDKLLVEKAERLSIINPFSSLQLFEYAYDNLNETETQTEEQIEVNMFKAILLTNEKNMTAASLGFASVEGMEPDHYYGALALSQTFPYSELVNYDKGEILTGQLIKSIFLFEYLEQEPKTAPLLAKFLAFYECDDWKDFLRKIFPLALAYVKSDREAHIDIVVGQEPESAHYCRFLDKLITLDASQLSDCDFRKIRSKPFFKQRDGEYRIIYGLFVLELIHKGVYFKLNEINDSLPAGVRIKNFRSLYCDDFSEKKLLYSILGSIYQNRYLEFSGEEMKGLGINAEPDYYIRNGNSLFLFESKDILINAEVKSTYDYKLHKAEFKKKLYFDSNKNKAVKQLARNVQRFLTKQFPFDQNYKPQNVQIYPILIVHDHQFDLAGLNLLINEWFTIEMEKLKEQNLPIDRVRPITIINIDSLIFHQDLFRHKSIRLNLVIDEYIRHTSLKISKLKNKTDAQRRAAVAKTVVPFSLFLTNYAGSKNLRRAPEMIRDKGISLVNKF